MNVSGTTVSATGHKGGLGDGLYDRAGARPDLDLDFARTKSLKDRVSKEELITFKREASRIRGSTYVDENGLIKIAGHNLVRNSHQIGESSTWEQVVSSGASLTLTMNTTETAAPNGMFEATKLVMDSGTTASQLTCVNNNYSGFTSPFQANDFAIFSVYLKSATNSNQIIQLSMNGTGRGVFTVTPEWQRFAIRATRNQIHHFVGRIGVRNANTASNPPQSDGSYINQHVEFYAWGAQLEFDGTTGLNTSPGSTTGYTGPIGELVRTGSFISGAPRFTHDPVTKESKGLLVESQATNLIAAGNADLTHWFKTGISVTTIQTAPTGSVEANVLKAIVGNTDTKTIYHTTQSSNISALKYTFSVFLKKGTVVNSNDVSRALIKIGQNGEKAKATVDLTNGTINVTTGTGSIENYGNGWYRASITTSVALSNSVNVNSFVLVLNSSGQNTYTGAGESIYFYGPQLETGEAATSYIPTYGYYEQLNGVTRSPDLVKIDGDNFGTYRTNLVTNTSFRKNYDGWLDNNTTTLEPHAAASPFGTYDAGKLIATGSGSSQHQFRQNLTFEPSVKYSASVYVKAGSHKIGRLGLTWNDGSSNTFNVVSFNLNEGYVDGNNRPNQGFTTGTITSSSVTPVGNNWFRVQMVSATTASTIASANVAVSFLDNNGGANFTANDENFFVWGVQVTKADTNSEFIPSTDKFDNRQSNATFVDGNGIIRRSMCNRLLYSEELDNSYWQSQSINKSANVAIAPNGTQTADKLIPTTYNGPRHLFYKSLTLLGAISVYAKADGFDYISVVSQRDQNTQGTTAAGVSVNLTDGSIHDITSDRATAEVIDVGNGWYRIILKRTDGLSQNHTLLQPHDGNTVPNGHPLSQGGADQNYGNYRVSYQGDGIKGVLVWGFMQTNDLTEAGDYHKTTDTISGPPRYSHDPETLTPTGLYLEPEATNLLPYSEDFSQSEWNKDDVSLDSNTTATTAPDGTNTATLLTATGSTSDEHRIRESNFSLNANPYTLSAFIKFNTSNHVLFSVFKNNQTQNGGPTNNIIYKRAKLNSDGSITISSGGTGTVITEKYPNGWYRFLVTSESTIGTHNGSIKISVLQDATAETFVANGESIYVWGAQIENSSSGTSYIKTTGQANGVTRSADIFTSTATEVLDRTNGAKPAFYTKSGLTAFVRGTNQPNPPTYAFRFFEFTGGHSNGNADFSLTSNTSGTKIGIFQHTDTNHAEPQGSGSGTSAPNTTLGLDNKIAARYQTDNARVNLNGEEGPLVNTSLNNGIDTRSSNRLCIGANGSSSGVGTTRILNGTIKRLTFWKTPLPDSKLDKLTS